MQFVWDWQYTVTLLPQLFDGFKITLFATILGTLIALVLGLMIALLRISSPIYLSRLIDFFVQFIRSTPILIQLYFMFYVLPDLGIRLSPLSTGILVLGVHYSAYMSEVYRAGLESVPKTQWEAAKALNLTYRHTFFRIILPQALPPIVPALGNYFIAMFKDTPLLSTITVMEILNVAKNIGSDTFRYLEPLTLVGIFFLVISLIASICIKKIETTVCKQT